MQSENLRPFVVNPTEIYPGDAVQHRAVNPAQVKRFRELPQLIANEPDPEKVKHLAAELQDLASLELEEMRSKFMRRCPTCGLELGVHTAEELEECTRKQQRED